MRRKRGRRSKYGILKYVLYISPPTLNWKQNTNTSSSVAAPKVKYFFFLIFALSLSFFEFARVCLFRLNIACERSKFIIVNIEVVIRHLYGAVQFNCVSSALCITGTNCKYVIVINNIVAINHTQCWTIGQSIERPSSTGRSNFGRGRRRQQSIGDNATGNISTISHPQRYLSIVVLMFFSRISYFDNFGWLLCTVQRRFRFAK